MRCVAGCSPCRASGKQQHNARYQFGEAVIRYSFHPRCGETVIVTGRNRRGDEVALTVRQPDGTLAQMPIWMTEDRGACRKVFPRTICKRVALCRACIDATMDKMQPSGIPIHNRK